MKHALLVPAAFLFVVLPVSATEILVGREILVPNNPGMDEANREGELQTYLFMGQAGIDKDGMLVVRSTAGVPPRALEEMSRAIGVENDLRKAAIDDTLRRRGLPADKRAEVASELATKWRSGAEGNTWVQRDDGSWAQGPPR
jgi:hypothetical protein